MKSIYFLIGFLIFTGVCSGQEIKATIKLDFSDKVFSAENFTCEKCSKFNEKLNDLKPGDFYTIEIENINLNLFEVSINSEDSVLSKPLETPIFGTFDFDVIGAISSGIKNLDLATISFQEIEKHKTQENEKYKNDTLVHGADFVITLDDTFKNIILNQRFQEKVNGQLNNEVERIDNLIFDIYRKKPLSLQLESKDYNSFDIDRNFENFIEIRNIISQLSTEVYKNKQEYINFSLWNKDPISEKGLKKEDSSIKENYQILTKTLEEILNLISADNINTLLSSVAFLENNKSNSYNSLPIQFTKEQTEITITIEPRDEKFLQNTYSTKILFPINKKDYVSAGISFYSSGLYDEVYSTLKTPVNDSLSNYQLNKDKGDKVELGMAALLRYGTKFDDNQLFGMHGSLGVGIPLTGRTKPKVLLGGGMSLGKKHMLSLDAGLIAGYSDRLRSSVDLSKTYTAAPEDYMLSELKFSWFVAIGYIYRL